MTENNRPLENMESSSDEKMHGSFWDMVVLGTGMTAAGMIDESSSSESSSSESSSHDQEQFPNELICTDWHTNDEGGYKTQSCWNDGNMWVYRKKKTHR
ncbi:hypothetical protein [Neobacillus muris]|uniref:hypothetical protein n=1 Tax=Neobacillus muris TaxID=2941334 RepID=UPI00203EC612|nr:hypothetical protein [Neobacillus muris]